jgi:hypothetical protein
MAPPNAALPATAGSLLTKSLPPPPAPLPAPPPPAAGHKLSIALVSHGRPDAMLPLAVSMLNLQTKLVSTDIQTDLHIVNTFDEALGAARARGSHLLAVDTNVGFDPEFVTRALESPHQIVSAVYPVPGVNWDRVKAAAPGSKEPINCRGNAYNAVPAPSAALVVVDGYVEAAAPLLGCVLVKAGVVAEIIKRHPEAGHADGTSLARETVVDGKLLAAHETFARLWGKPVHIDVDHPATLTAPMSYAGSVGARHFLR